MKLYFAGADAKVDLFEKLGVKKILIAFPFVDKVKTWEKEWFLDSGAFTFYSQKKEGDLIEYIKFIKSNENIKTYASLDVINDSLQSYNNFIEMLKNKTKPIPTFHYGENINYLKRYISKTDYIAIGGLVPYKNKIKNLFSFLDKVFSISKDIKLHGFGLNNWEALKRYPFYSVDATSWHNPDRYGQHFIMDRGKLSRYDGRKVSMFRFYDKEQQITNSIKEFLKAEKYLTALWTKRGVTWNE